MTEIEDITQRRLNLLQVLRSLVSASLLLSATFFQRQRATELTVYGTLIQTVCIFTKQYDVGLTVGEHIISDMDLILQIQEELNVLRDNNKCTSFQPSNKQKGRVKDEGEGAVITNQMKVAQVLAEEFFGIDNGSRRQLRISGKSN